MTIPKFTLPWQHRTTPSNPLARHRAFLERWRARRVQSRFDAVSRVLRRLSPEGGAHTAVAMHVGLAWLHRTLVQPTRTTTLQTRDVMTTVRHTELARTLLERQRAVELRVRTERATLDPAQRAAVAREAATPVNRTVAPKVAMTLAKPRAAAAPAQRMPEALAKQDVVTELRQVVERARQSERAAVVLPAQELSRVTDHVIRQLDQRVLSYRERTGRV